MVRMLACKPYNPVLNSIYGKNVRDWKNKCLIKFISERFTISNSLTPHTAPLIVAEGNQNYFNWVIGY